MLYKIDYTRRSDRQRRSRFVNHAADQTEAVTRFMDQFFRDCPGDKVRLEGITEIELTGDLQLADVIDAAAEEAR